MNFLNLRFFVQSDSFAPINKSIMAYKLPSTNLERFLVARNILRVKCPKLAKMAIFKPP